jgi:hypothetical protein
MEPQGRSSTPAAKGQFWKAGCTMYNNSFYYGDEDVKLK